MTEGLTADPYDPRPLDLLKTLGVVEAEEAPGLTHVEAYTMSGLLSVLWHGPHDADRVVACVGGAMGGMLGPGKGIYPAMGRLLPDEGVGVMRVGYRRPNDIEACTLDLCAAIDLAWRRGARHVITMGHSFGGAIAIRAAIALPAVKGVVTFATQSAGCEEAEGLNGRPFLLFHGSHDEILPFASSEMVRFIAGSGELLRVEGEGHLFAGVHDQLLDRTLDFVRTTFAECLSGDAPV